MVILYVAIAAMVTGLLFMFAMRTLAGCMVWIAILLYFTCLVILALGFYYKGRGKR